MQNPLDGLNCRYKAGLCLTFVAAGTLLLSAPVPQMAWFVMKTTGIVLIGLAVTWFMGSLARTPGLVFSPVLFCIGVLIAVFPVWRDWQSYRTALRQFEAVRAVVLAGRVSARDLPTGSDDLMTRLNRFAGGGIDWDLAECEAKAEHTLERAFVPVPDGTTVNWYCTSPTRVPSFSLRACIGSHPVSSAGGFPLATFGLLAFVLLIRQPSKPNSQTEMETTP